MLTVMYLDIAFVKIQSLTKLSAQASKGRLRLLELMVKAADTLLTKEIHRKVQGCLRSHSVVCPTCSMLQWSNWKCLTN